MDDHPCDHFAYAYASLHLKIANTGPFFREVARTLCPMRPRAGDADRDNCHFCDRLRLAAARGTVGIAPAARRRDDAQHLAVYF